MAHNITISNKTKTLHTGGKYVKEDIALTVTDCSASLSGSATASSSLVVAPGPVTVSKLTSDGSNAGVNIQASTGNVTTTEPNSGYYVAVQATAAANTTGISGNITGSGSSTVTVSKAGWFDAKTLSGDITLSGTATATTSAKSSSATYIPINTAAISATGSLNSYSAGTISINSVAPASGESYTLPTSSYSIQTSQDTNDGTYYYLKVAAPALSTSRTLTKGYNVTSAGYVPAKNYSETQSVSVTAATSGNKYIKIPSATLSGVPSTGKGSFTGSNATSGESNSAQVISNSYYAVKTSAVDTSHYYIKGTASGSGTVRPVVNSSGYANSDLGGSSITTNGSSTVYIEIPKITPSINETDITLSTSFGFADATNATISTSDTSSGISFKCGGDFTVKKAATTYSGNQQGWFKQTSGEVVESEKSIRRRTENTDYYLTGLTLNSGKTLSNLNFNGKIIITNTNGVNIHSSDALLSNITGNGEINNIGSNSESNDILISNVTDLANLRFYNNKWRISGKKIYINSAEVTDANGDLKYASTSTSQDGGTVTFNVNSSGWIPEGPIPVSIPNGTISTGTTNQTTYKQNTTAVVPSKGYLYIGAGYYPNTQISLATLIPDDSNYSNAGNGHILSGYEAYNTDGTKLVGTINSITPSSTYYTSTNTGFGGLTGYTYINSATRYIKAGAYSVSELTLTKGTSTSSGTNVTVSSNNNGIYITTTIPVSAKATATGTAGWINAGSNNETNSLSPSAITYISGVTVPTGKTFSVKNNAADSTTNVTYGQNTFNIVGGEVTIESQATVTNSDGDLIRGAIGGTSAGGSANLEGLNAESETNSGQIISKDKYSIETSTSLDTNHFYLKTRPSATTYVTPKVTTTGWLTSGTVATNIAASASSTRYIALPKGTAATPSNSSALVSASTSLSGTTLTVQANVTPTVSTGWITTGTIGTVKISGTVPTETKTATGSGDITPTSGKLISKVTVPASESTTTADGSITITQSGRTITASGTASAKTTVSTAGWISGEKTGTKNLSKTYTIPLGNLTVTAESGSITHGTVTPSLGFSSSLGGATASGYGFTTTKPSGNYFTLDPGASITTQPSFTPSASYDVGAGYLLAVTAGSVSGSSTNVTPTIAAGTNYYIPIVAPTFSGGGLTATTNYSKTPTVTLSSGSDTNMSNIDIGSKDTTNYPYYFKISGASEALSGSTTVTRAACTYSNTAGAIAAHSNSSVLSETTSSPTVTVGAGSASSYIKLKSATVNVSGGGLTKGTASGGGLSGGDLTAGDGAVSATSSTSMTNAIKYHGTSAPTTGYYIKVDGYGTVNRAKIDRAAFSQTVTRAAVTDTRTAGYLPARASTNILSSGSATVTLSAGSIAASSLASNTATKYYMVPTGELSVSNYSATSSSGNVTGSNIALSTSNSSGISVTGKGTITAKASVSVTTAGYVTSGVTGSDASLTSSGQTKYVTGITLGSGKTLSSVSNSGTITTMSGTGKVTTQSGTQTIATNSGTLNVTSNTGTVNVVANTGTVKYTANWIIAKDANGNLTFTYSA